jgi:hypothetical protein
MVLLEPMHTEQIGQNQIRLNTTDTLKIINGRLHIAHRRATDTLIASSLDLVRAG